MFSPKHSRRTRSRRGHASGRVCTVVVVDRERVLADTVEGYGSRKFLLGDLVAKTSVASVGRDRVRATERAIVEAMEEAFDLDLTDEDDLSDVEIEVERAEFDLGSMSGHVLFRLRLLLPEG